MVTEMVTGDHDDSGASISGSADSASESRAAGAPGERQKIKYGPCMSVAVTRGLDLKKLERTRKLERHAFLAFSTTEFCVALSQA